MFTANLIPLLLPVGHRLCVEGLQVDYSQQRLIFLLSSHSPATRCPACRQTSDHVHSHYTRTVADLPWANWTVSLQVAVRKFRCRQKGCQRQVFCERLPQVAPPWARQTPRLRHQRRQIGLALGGRAGERLSRWLDRASSRNSLLRLIRSTPRPERATPRVLGVDDFANRKGQDYGTVLIDLERHQAVELLPDRQASTLAQWLSAHPGVEILSRDRSGAYAEGGRQGAPHAVQVADRFHLLRNLAEVLITIFTHHLRASKAACAPTAVALPALGHDSAMPPSQPSDAVTAAAAPPPVTVPAEPTTALARARREQRLKDYQQARELYQQGWTQQAIGTYLGIKRQRLRSYVHSDCFPDRHRPASILDPYKPYLLQRWNAGCRTGTLLYEAITQQGYPGKRSNVFTYVRRLRDAQGLPLRSRTWQPLPSRSDPSAQALTPRQAAWLVLRRPERRDEQESAHLAHLRTAHPQITETIWLTERFVHLLRQRRGDQLEGWLAQAEASAVSAFHQFAKGLRQDYEAVKAGLSLPWSNGPVEGHINRLKMLKRQMFGRANLDVLQKRFLLAP